MLNLNKYNSAFTAKLDEQLSVYVTIGTPKIESPMWFQFTGQIYDIDFLKFKSSQASYMYFEIPILDEDKQSEFLFQPTYDHFRAVKYAHIKENWPTVYYELRPNEKPQVKIIEPIKEVKEPIIEVTDYQKQANDFLTATGTKFTATFKTNDFYFPGDKQTRDIYSIVLKNDRHRYRFNFGQSITNSNKNIAPTPYDVLACITKYDCGNFENFCNEFGYDIDSRSAYKSYKAVMKEWKNVELLFTPDQLEILQEIN